MGPGVQVGNGSYCQIMIASTHTVLMLPLAINIVADVVVDAAVLVVDVDKDPTNKLFPEVRCSGKWTTLTRRTGRV